MKKIQENTIWKTWKKKIPKKYSPYVAGDLVQNNNVALPELQCQTFYGEIIEIFSQWVLKKATLWQKYQIGREK